MRDGNDPEVELAAALAEVARALAVEHDLEPTYRRICTLAVETMEHCESAGMSLVRGRKRIESLAGTDEVPRDIDRLQAETAQGPCIDAIREKEVFATGRLSEEHRWPEFTCRATEATGIESILSFRLFVEEDTMGALNLYSTRVDAFDDHDHAIGAVFAAHAGSPCGSPGGSWSSSARPRPGTSSAKPRACLWPASTSATSRPSTSSDGHRNAST